MAGRAGCCRAGPGTAGDLQGTGLSVTGPPVWPGPCRQTPPRLCPVRQGGDHPHAPRALLSLPSGAAYVLGSDTPPQGKAGVHPAPRLLPRPHNWSPSWSLSPHGNQRISVTSPLAHTLPLLRPRYGSHCPQDRVLTSGRLLRPLGLGLAASLGSPGTQLPPQQPDSVSQAQPALDCLWAFAHAVPSAGHALPCCSPRSSGPLGPQDPFCLARTFRISFWWGPAGLGAPKGPPTQAVSGNQSSPFPLSSASLPGLPLQPAMLQLKHHLWLPIPS